MNKHLVAYYLGRLTLGLGTILVIPFAVALYYNENDGTAFIISSTIVLYVGYRLRLWGLQSRNLDDLSINDSLGITGIGWIFLSCLGMLPYLFSGHLNPLDALFETMAGFTGMGGTVFRDLSVVSNSLLVWRSLSQWVGGLGIIVIFVALLPQTSQSALHLYQAESSRLSSGRRRPRLREMALAMFKLYLAFTFVAFIVFWLVGMTPFSAANHALSIISTGGFSVHDDAIAYYGSTPVELAAIFFMLLAGGNFNLYYAALTNGARQLFKDTEFRVYLGIVITAALFITTMLCFSDGYNLTFSDALRQASFVVASQEATGISAFNYEAWPISAQCVIIFLMLFGGCAGSTTAGLRISRLIMLVKMAVHAVKVAISPRRHIVVRIDRQRIDTSVLYSVGRYFFLYIGFMGLWALLFSLDGMMLYDAFSLSLSTMTTVGLGFGSVGPMGSYAYLSPWAKIVACFSMLMGRLEMFPLLALMTPEFWHKKRGW